jgi:hypothetical protein
MKHHHYTELVPALIGSFLIATGAAATVPRGSERRWIGHRRRILVVVHSALNGCNPQPSATATPPAPHSATPSQSTTPTQTAPPTRSATPGRTATPTPRFVDNGDGTITDTTTGLMWEKKGDDGGLHDLDRTFTWSMSGSTLPNGQVFTNFIAALNAGNFAGRRDWRLPTLEELQTIVSTGGTTPGRPVVPPAFDDDCRPGCTSSQCSCTKALNYWTATIDVGNNQRAWYVLFNTGQSGTGLKTLQFYARAVRGGS